MPSLFRGVVVADSPLGVRVVSVEESSQAHLADLRPEDLIVQVDDQPIHSIDAFAAVSLALKGRAVRARLLILRNGQPRQLLLHLYSYPILTEWNLVFVPEHDVRFAEPHTAQAYWVRLGRGFEIAEKPHEAMNAYLNALHATPQDLALALKVSDLLWQLGGERLDVKRFGEAFAIFQQAVVLLERLFEHPLTEEQLAEVKRQLDHTLAQLRSVRERLDQNPTLPTQYDDRSHASSSRSA